MLSKSRQKPTIRWLMSNEKPMRYRNSRAPIWCRAWEKVRKRRTTLCQFRTYNMQLKINSTNRKRPKRYRKKNQRLTLKSSKRETPTKTWKLTWRFMDWRNLPSPWNSWIPMNRVILLLASIWRFPRKSIVSGKPTQIWLSRVLQCFKEQANQLFAISSWKCTFQSSASRINLTLFTMKELFQAAETSKVMFKSWQWEASHKSKSVTKSICFPLRRHMSPHLNTIWLSSSSLNWTPRVRRAIAGSGYCLIRDASRKARMDRRKVEVLENSASAPPRKPRVSSTRSKPLYRYTVPAKERIRLLSERPTLCAWGKTWPPSSAVLKWGWTARFIWSMLSCQMAICYQTWLRSTLWLTSWSFHSTRAYHLVQIETQILQHLWTQERKRWYTKRLLFHLSLWQLLRNNHWRQACHTWAVFIPLLRVGRAESLSDRRTCLIIKKA